MKCPSCGETSTFHVRMEIILTVNWHEDINVFRCIPDSDFSRFTTTNIPAHTCAEIRCNRCLDIIRTSIKPGVYIT